jgi:hypothetical protein
MLLADCAKCLELSSPLGFYQEELSHLDGEPWRDGCDIDMHVAGGVLDETEAKVLSHVGTSHKLSISDLFWDDGS